MKPALLFLTLGSAVAFAQQTAVIGTIERFTRGGLTVRTSRGSFTISTDDRTVTVRDRTSPGLSTLRTGDEVSVHCEGTAPGKLVATKIWANLVTFSGAVREIRGDEVELVTPRGERKLFHVHPDTTFGANRDDMVEGKEVRVVGFDLGNGTLDAARVALYNTDIPADRPVRK